MTFKTARQKLKKYYRITELAEEYQLSCTDIIIVVGNTQKKATSPEEAATIRKLDLLARVEDTEIVLKNLPGDYQKFLALRFRDEMSVTMAGRQMHMSSSSADRFEDKVLSAYIAVLGYVPVS